MHILKRFSGWLTLAFFATVGGAMVAADPAFAKVDVDNLTIGGEARIRYEIRNNACFSSNVRCNESAGSHRIRVNVGYDLTPDVSFFAQLQEARVWGSEGGTTQATVATTSGIGAVSSSNNNGTGVDLHQGYILLKNVLVPGLSAKIGRQEIMFGDHRLFGNFGWSQIGNAFDAVRLTHSMPIGDVDLFWARIVDTETTGANNGVIFNTNTSTTTGTRDQDIYGAYVTLKMIPNWTVEPYYFLLKDSRTPGPTAFQIATPQAPGQVRSTLGGRINGKAAGLDATLEGAWQFGSASSGVAGASANDTHINAVAGAARAGYTFDAVPMKPRLGFEFDYASGNNCNNGANGPTPGTPTCFRANTFDNLYPTNHFHYGYMDLMSWKNMVNYMLVFDIKPSPVSKLQVNFLWLRLASHLDNWYRAAQVVYGATAPTNTSSSLGRELDVHYWHTFKEKFKFELGYGHFWAGSYMNPANGNAIGGVAAASGANSGVAPTGSGQNWGYVMGSVLF